MVAEPVLQMDDIQGMVLPGFLKPHQALIYLSVPIVARDRKIFCQVLQGMLPELSTGTATLYDRRTRCPAKPARKPLAALGFSQRGLDMLCYDLQTCVPSRAFQVGMNERAGLLGDPDPRTWNAQFRGQQPHALLVVAGDASGPVHYVASTVADQLSKVDGSRPHVEYGGACDPERAGQEHFGFVDSISQPGIRGRCNSLFGTDLTLRHLPEADPEYDLYGYPGQHLVWPGEFVLGYPASSPDPRIAGPVREVPHWMRNGSFLVYRRLYQDVAGFRKWLIDEAARLSTAPGFGHLTPALLAAKLVGRWPSGAPLVRAPGHDDADLGADPFRNNDFRYDDATPAPVGQQQPSAPADIFGELCPVGAHIRKVNVRDQASDMGGASATYTRRILRMGVPYGPQLPYDPTEEQEGEDRGLLFLSIQASIEDQFEFLQARWMNSAVRPRGLGGHDMIMGQSSGTRSCPIYGKGLTEPAVVTSTRSFVQMTGGGYFFMPSLSTLKWLLEQGMAA